MKGKSVDAKVNAKVGASKASAAKARAAAGAARAGTAKVSAKENLKYAGKNTPEEPSTTPLSTVLPWVLAITKPVHSPLLFSICMRVISQLCNVLLFACAGGGLMAAWLGVPLPILGALSAGKLAAALIVIALLKAATYYLEQFSGHYVAFKALELLRTTAFSQLWPKAPGVVTRSRSGELYASLTRDIDRIEVLYAHTIAPVVAGVLVPLTVVCVGCAVCGWVPMLVPMICLGISVFIVPLIGLRAGIEGASLSLLRRAHLTQHTTDSVFGAREATGYGREAERYAGMEELSLGVTAAARKPAVYRGIRRGMNAGFIPAAVLGAILGGAYSGLSPELIAFLAAGCLAIFEAPCGLEGAAGGIDVSLASARRLYDMCTAEDPVRDGSEDFAPQGPVSVEWRNVTYHYPGMRSRNVLDGFSLSVPAGGHAALVGPSGIGKSTAVQLLLRYDDPQGGAVFLDGKPVQDYTLDSLRRGVTFVPQRAELLRGSVADNLRLADPNASDERLWEVLSIVQLADEVRAFPQGLNEPTGTEGAGISGGQMQRLVLARALLTKPAVLVLDEFSVNLPESTDAAIREALALAFPHLTVIEETHRSSSLPAEAIVKEF